MDGTNTEAKRRSCLLQNKIHDCPSHSSYSPPILSPLPTLSIRRKKESRLCKPALRFRSISRPSQLRDTVPNRPVPTSDRD
jgi:hypothetical protein